jgi:site-specific DNA-methyltransferase (adenine-specific)
MPCLDSVDVVIADPPYGTTKCAWDAVIDIDRMWGCIKGLTADRSAIVLTAQTPFDKVLGVSNLEMLKYEWIWEKTNATGHLNAKKMPLKGHENVLIFYRKLPTYNPQMTQGHERKTATKRDTHSECYGKALKTTHYDSTERYPRSVQKFSSDKQRENLHPTQKPVKLFEYLVKTYSNPGDTILDFSMGSGTTGVACVNLGRIFIGIDDDPKHFETALQRIKNVSRQGRLF